MANNSSHNNPSHSHPNWDALKDQNFDHSFPVVERWIKENEGKIKKRVIYKKRRRNSIILLLVAAFVLLIGGSLLLKTDQILKYGNLIHFNIDKTNNALIKQLGSLQQLLNISFFEFSNKEQSFLSYVLVIANDETTENVNRELRSLKGISQLQVNAIEYKVRESLLTGFLRKTFHIQSLKSKAPVEELEKNIQAQLQKKGIDVKVNISGRDSQIILTPGEAMDLNASDSSNVTINKPSQDSLNTKQSSDKTEITANEPAALEQFNWLLGSWKVKNVPNETWHYWLRIKNDLLKCFVVELAADGRTSVTAGFSIRHTTDGENILSLKGSQWKFMHAYENSFVFKNDAEANPNVSWTLKDGFKTWQSIISSEGNAEFINLVKQDNEKLKEIVTNYSRSHPDKLH